VKSIAIALSGLALTTGLSAAQAAEAPLRPDQQAFLGLYRELIETNTSLSEGSCTDAAAKMAVRLRAGGIPESQITRFAVPDHPREGGLVAVYPGTDAKLKPMLLLAHIDVVEAKREDWQRDPFKLVEEDGWFYARGASDDKAMAAVFTDSLVRYLQSGFKPRRDIKLALTCGEETPDTFNGVHWILQTKPQALSAAFALNEGAGGELDAEGRPVALQIQAGEKIYQDFELDTAGPGGHSSRPTHDNPLVRMSQGLAKIGAYDFPIQLNDTVRAYFKAQIELQPPTIGADMRAVLASPPDLAAEQRLWTINPSWNGITRTTCIPTQIEGGHAPNAIPQHVRANVNCRILPAGTVEDVQRQLVQVMGDPAISIKPIGELGSPTTPPPLSAQVMQPVRKLAEQIWPGVAIVPTMSTGATDGRYLNAAGIPTYGLSGMFHDAEGSHAHGLNERIRVKSLMDGRRFLYEIVKIYANQTD
jgi:acetylornithine deacetylase/succinyl-diaminopimelate desuccinylase-like protein